MAEEEQQLESPKEEKKGGKLKLIIIGVVLLAVLGGGGYFAYTKFIGPKFFGSEETAEGAEGEEAGEEKAPEPGETELFSLPTFVVNLADPLGRRYLKIAIDVEVVNSDAVEQLTTSESKVRDAIILLLSSKTFAELATMEDKIRLKQEIVERLNQVLGGSKVLRVYFTEMVVQ
jgi:flagellar FliL protein